MNERPTRKQIAALVLMFLMVISAITYAVADMLKPEYLDVWILCQPDSFVNIRAKPSTRSSAEGYLMCGDKVQFTGKTENGFLHCICSNELGEGWVYCGYVVLDEPIEVNEKRLIEANGRVACRRTITGNRRCWVVNGSEVNVYWESDEWSVTDKGFIMTEFIGGAVNE